MCVSVLLSSGGHSGWSLLTEDYFKMAGCPPLELVSGTDDAIAASAWTDLIPVKVETFLSVYAPCYHRFIPSLKVRVRVEQVKYSRAHTVRTGTCLNLQG